MDSPSIDGVTSRQHAKGGHRPQGTSLLEMMLVVVSSKLSALSRQLSASVLGIGNRE
jgi:hypothetical protein